MVQIKPSEHILILGRTGQGKTFWTKNVLLPALKRQKNNVLVILDPKNEYEAPHTAISPKDLNGALYGQKRPISKVIRLDVSEPDVSVAEEYLRAAWSPFRDINPNPKYKPTFGVRFLIEDAPIFYDSPFATPPMLKRWVAIGRSHQKTIIMTSQRMQLIPKTVASQVEHAFIFKLGPYDNKRVIGEYYGDTAYRVVQSLPKYGYTLISDLYDDPLVFNPYKPKRGQLPKPEIGIEIL
jgi:Cdc6-like AAA superfamily ATPase